MNPTSPNARRPRKLSLSAEALEGREMMTGGVGSTFAIIPATITKVGGTASVSFNLDPKLFKDPGNKPFVLGLDIAPNTSSSVNPIINSVTTPTGKTIKAVHATFDPKVTRSGVQASSTLSSAVLVTIPGLPAANAKSFTYKVNVGAVGKTSGGVLVGFYLAGDADGTGTVNQASLNAISAAMGTNANDTTGKYSFDADVNRDGEITKADLAIATKNLGVTTTVSPVISANLGSAGIADAKNRIVNIPTVAVTGAATPGATISYTPSTGGVATTTTADSSGNYSINLNLAPGSNTFNVVATDAFKQKISGAIAAITYNSTATAAATTAALAASQSSSTPAPTTSSTSTTTATTPTSTATTTTTTTTTPTTTTMPSTPTTPPTATTPASTTPTT